MQPIEHNFDIARHIERYLAGRRGQGGRGMPTAIATVRAELARRRWRAVDPRDALMVRRANPNL